MSGTIGSIEFCKKNDNNPIAIRILQKEETGTNGKTIITKEFNISYKGHTYTESGIADFLKDYLVARHSQSKLLHIDGSVRSMFTQQIDIKSFELFPKMIKCTYLENNKIEKTIDLELDKEIFRVDEHINSSRNKLILMLSKTRN